jgi:hypothetical protein
MSMMPCSLQSVEMKQRDEMAKKLKDELAVLTARRIPARVKSE